MGKNGKNPNPPCQPYGPRNLSTATTVPAVGIVARHRRRECTVVESRLVGNVDSASNNHSYEQDGQ